MLSARIHEAATALHIAGVRIESGETWLVAQCDHATLAAAMREAGATCDALIVDAPYSARTHEGHDAGAASANHVKANGVADTGRERREIDYAHWTGADVFAFCEAWMPVADGWSVSVTDDALFHPWRDTMGAFGRQTFQDIPCVIRGMTVRLTGDGPSSWAVHAAVSRPRSKKWATWGTLDGAYVGPSERQAVVGGKPLWLMRALVRDYSAPGALVCDPCMGAGTTLVAAVEEGRLALGCEPDEGRFELAVGRVRRAHRQAALPLTRDTRTADQLGLPEGEVG